MDFRRGQEFAFFLRAKQGNAFHLATAPATTTVPLNQLRLLAYSKAVGANSVVTLPLPSLLFLHQGPLDASPTVGTAESLSLEMDRGTFVK